jgi:hypothetical protein
LEHLILEVFNLDIFLIVLLLLFLYEVYPLSGLGTCLSLHRDSLGDQFLDPGELDLKGEGVLLGNVNDLVDDELLVRDQFGRMQGLSDDLEHVDVGERLQRVGSLDLEDPGQETLEVNL